MENLKVMFTAGFWGMVFSVFLALAFLPDAVDAENPQRMTYAFISVMNSALAIGHGLHMRKELRQETV